MNRDKFRELLRGKIDSLERWKQVCEEVGVRWDRLDRDYWELPRHASTLHYAGMDYIGLAVGIPVDQRWWLFRETARMQLGVYPSPTDVMQNVIDQLYLGSYFIHISRDDMNMVAYTPSIEYGLADRQVKMTFGKMLRKLVVLATDTHIQRLEASHRSELDPTFLVARTQEEIQKVYTTMAGDTGCMRYEPKTWDLPNDLHPSAAYCYAGLAVAYTEVDGRITSRSVIYDNPDDAKDKRYVRIYGDGALKRKLELAGYVCRNLQGAKLKAIDLNAVNARRFGKGKFLVPYLDGSAGNQGEVEGCYGYIVKGEDAIRLISRQQAQRLTPMGYAAPRFKSTDPYHTVPMVEPDKLMFTCGLSGNVVNALEDDVVWIYHGGAPKQAALRVVKENAPGLLNASVHHWPGADDGEDEGRVPMYMSRQDRQAPTCFVDNDYIGGWVFDTPANRRHCHQVLLDAATYGQNQWVHNSGAVCENPSAPASEQVWYKKQDCIVVFDEEGQQCWMPQAKLDALRQASPKDYVAIAPLGSQKAVSHVRNPRLVTTLGKRKCVRDWHSVVQLFDGSWDYSQNVRNINILGIDFAVSDKQHVNKRDARVPEDVMRTALQVYVNAAEALRRHGTERMVLRLNEYFVTRLRNGIENHFFFLKGEMLFRGHVWGDHGSLEQMRAAVIKLATMNDEDIAGMLDASYVPVARAWQHHAAIMFKVYDETLAAWGVTPAAPAPSPLDAALVTAARHIRDERFAAAA